MKKKYIPIFIFFFFPILLLNAQQARWRLASGTNGFAAADIDIYYSDPDTLYAIGGWTNSDTASIIGSGFLISTNRGETWRPIKGGPGTDYGALKVDPFDSKRIYVSVYGFDGESNDIWMTKDGGGTWTRLFGGRSYSAPVVEIDPVDLRTVYVGVGPAFIRRSTDRGETWESITTPPAPYPPFLNALTIAPSNNSVLYAAYVSGLFKSTDRGTSWTQLPLDPGHWGISCVAVDPHNSDIVYAAVYSRGLPPGGVFKSTDGGLTWNEKNNGLDSTNWDINTILINPKNSNDIFFGVGNIGNKILFRSTNNGESWNFFKGLPDSGGVGTMVIDTINNKMFIAVNVWTESGIYIYDSILTFVEDKLTNRLEAFLLFQNYPNPFNPVTTIKYTLPVDEKVLIKVYDILGREIAELVNEFKTAGKYSIQFDGNNLSSGVYFYSITAGTNRQVKKMILSK